ncbi:MAG TPA: amidohydrolase family protein [Polyangiaceae bacterium]|nr:amidohydrolase family protein [Polyangiaceae bacterium]
MSPRFPIIDAHAHMAADDAETQALLTALDVRVLNIALGLDSDGKWRQPSDFGSMRFCELSRRRPDRFAWCTSFDLPRFTDPEYAERVIAELERDVADGAVACKVWKNVGMEVRDPHGNFVLLDHPILRPVFEHLERRRLPVILHVGEPKACWLPLDERSPHHDYYRDHPEWHMVGRSDVPSWESLQGARDRVLARHPRLTVVGAHLGSIEHDLVELGRRLERFPNLAVDSGGRLLDLALQEPAAVRAFFERYSDRILFGSDICLPRAQSEMDSEERRRSRGEIERAYGIALDYFTSQRSLELGRHRFQGIALAERDQKRFFSANAHTWLNLESRA